MRQAAHRGRATADCTVQALGAFRRVAVTETGDDVGGDDVAVGRDRHRHAVVLAAAGITDAMVDGFDPLDVVAPYEVLVAGSDYVGGELGVHLVTAEGPRTVVSGSRGLTLRATDRLDPAKPGYVIVPGAVGPLAGDPDDGVETIPVLLARFGETAAVDLMRAAMGHPDVTVATVCGGSLALAMAGLIDGRRANTHHLGVDVLEATGVVPISARVVDDGDLITAGGVTRPCLRASS